MTMQLMDIVLYSRDGELRRIPLKLGAVNIITGASKTGKSALLEIVDYCLGSSDCSIPVGEIRNSVLWYGVRLHLDKTQVFVGRPDPGRGRSTTTDIYLEVGKHLEIPSLERLQANTNVDGMIEYLTRLLNIEDNIHFPKVGQSRAPLEAHLRHSLFFLLQNQDEIANKKLLFHKQGEPYIPQAIKDVLPYFLGAMPKGALSIRQRIRKLSLRLRESSQALEEIKEARRSRSSTLKNLLAEAQEVGLVKGKDLQTLTPESSLRLLQRIARTRKLENMPASSVESAHVRLQSARVKLLELHKNVLHDLETVRTYGRDREHFVGEVNEQKSRLESLGLLEGELTTNASACPLCQQAYEGSGLQVSRIRSSLRELSQKLEGVRGDAPRLSDLTAQLDQRLTQLQRQLTENKQAIDAVTAESERVKSLSNAYAGKVHVLGRITYFLDTAKKEQRESGLARDVARLSRELSHLEKQVDPEVIQENVASSMNLIGKRITTLAEDMKLEHSQFPLRIDLGKLNVAADTPDGPIHLNKMGSGENWVGYHLAALFSLQDWWITKARPVPGFLMLDQPSQVYFPPDKDTDGGLGPVEENDRDALIRMFKLIFQEVERLAPSLQVIITDHADIQEEWFQGAVVEKWRLGKKLVPTTWLSK